MQAYRDGNTSIAERHPLYTEPERSECFQGVRRRELSIDRADKAFNAFANYNEVLRKRNRSGHWRLRTGSEGVARQRNVQGHREGPARDEGIPDRWAYEGVLFKALRAFRPAVYEIGEL